MEVINFLSVGSQAHMRRLENGILRIGNNSQLAPVCLRAAVQAAGAR
jgi:hypothetical protein